jgi:hypothetical protein
MRSAPMNEFITPNEAAESFLDSMHEAMTIVAPHLVRGTSEYKEAFLILCKAITAGIYMGVK